MCLNLAVVRELQNKWILTPRELWSRWAHTPQTTRRFLVNIMVGLGIAAAMSLFHQAKWIAELEDAAMDMMMAVNQSLPRMRGPSFAQTYAKFTFVDIDEDTYRQWGEPPQVPRSRLLDLIGFAQEGRALAVIVDVDLSRSGAVEEDDEALASYLAEQSGAPGAVPVILIRTFYPPSRATGNRDHLLRATILADREVGPALFWAQPLFRSSVNDNVIRFWQLVRVGCDRDEPVLVPSVQLLSVSILAGDGDGVEETRALLDDLNAGLPPACREIGNAGQALDRTVRVGSGRIDLGSGRTGERLVYTIPYRSGSELQVIPAGSIVRAGSERAYDLIAGKVVVIGTSYADARDTYRTPIGDMPGAVILINAVKSLGAYGQVRAPHALVKWTINVVLIVFLAWLFGWSESLLAEIAAGLAIVIVLLPLSFYFLKYGIWIDFAIPLLGMQVHHIVVELGDSYRGAVRK